MNPEEGVTVPASPLATSKDEESLKEMLLPKPQNDKHYLQTCIDESLDCCDFCRENAALLSAYCIYQTHGEFPYAFFRFRTKPQPEVVIETPDQHPLDKLKTNLSTCACDVCNDFSLFLEKRQRRFKFEHGNYVYMRKWQAFGLVCACLSVVLFFFALSTKSVLLHLMAIYLLFAIFLENAGLQIEWKGQFRTVCDQETVVNWWVLFSVVYVVVMFVIL